MNRYSIQNGEMVIDPNGVYVLYTDHLATTNPPKTVIELPKEAYTITKEGDGE